MPSRRTKIVPNEAPRAPKRRQKLEAPQDVADLVELAAIETASEADETEVDVNAASEGQGAEAEEHTEQPAIAPLKSVPVPVKFHPF